MRHLVWLALAFAVFTGCQTSTSLPDASLPDASLPDVSIPDSSFAFDAEPLVLPDAGHKFGGLPTPTGTGLPHVVSGRYASAATTISDGDVSSSAAIATSKLGTGTQSLGAQEFDSTVDTKGTELDVLPKHVQTTDATVTTFDSWTIASNSAENIAVLCTAIKSDSSQAGAWALSAAFRNAAGTVAQLGSTTATVVGTLDDASWAATVDNSTTTIRVRITGKAATTIQWSCITTRLKVIP